MTEMTTIALGDSPVLKSRPAELVLVPEPTGDDPAARVAAALKGAAPRPAGETRTGSLNPLLDQLVYGDNDLVGLVAYAMHEVHRRDWCTAFEAAHGRTPNATELNVFLVGERIERRLDTYRRLAEDALAKVAQGDTNLRRLAEGLPDLPRIIPGPLAGGAASAPSPSPVAQKPAPAPAAALAKPASTPAPAAGLAATASDKLVATPKAPSNLGKLAVYLLLLLVAVAALGYLLRYGIDATQMAR